MLSAWGFQMTVTLTGGCLCGAVRYEYSGDIGPTGYCHCTDCRRCTGSAFNVGVCVATEEFRVVAGRLKGFTKKGDSGNELTRHFCIECGSPIYTSAPSAPATIFVKAGSVDNPALVRPDHQKWTASEVPWAFIERDMPSTSRGKT
jgi:hypothetical protein